MSRLPLLRDDELEEEQRALYRAILGGKRGQGGGTSGLTYSGSGLVGPFNAWLRSPEIGERAQRLGEALRFSSSLPANLLEIAILVTAQHWRAQFEWWAHARFAQRAGVGDHVIFGAWFIAQWIRNDFDTPAAGNLATVHEQPVERGYLANGPAALATKILERFRLAARIVD